MYQQPNQPQYPQYPQYGAPQYAAPYYQPQRKKRTWLIVVAVIAAPVLFFGFFVGLGFLMYATADEVPGTAADRVGVMTVDDISPWMDDHTPVPSGESLLRRKYFDGSFDVEYTYDDPHLYIYCCVTVERNEQDARSSYQGIQIGNSVGNRANEFDMSEVEQNEMFQWGDQSNFYLVRFAGEPNGHRLITRKGTIIVEIVFTGAWFSESGPLRELLIPVLDRIITTHTARR